MHVGSVCGRGPRDLPAPGTQRSSERTLDLVARHTKRTLDCGNRPVSFLIQKYNYIPPLTKSGESMASPASPLPSALLHVRVSLTPIKFFLSCDVTYAISEPTCPGPLLLSHVGQRSRVTIARAEGLGTRLLRNSVIARRLINVGGQNHIHVTCRFYFLNSNTEWFFIQQRLVDELLGCIG